MSADYYDAIPPTPYRKGQGVYVFGSCPVCGQIPRGRLRVDDCRLWWAECLPCGFEVQVLKVVIERVE